MLGQFVLLLKSMIIIINIIIFKLKIFMSVNGRRSQTCDVRQLIIEAQLNNASYSRTKSTAAMNVRTHSEQ